MTQIIIVGFVVSIIVGILSFYYSEGFCDTEDFIAAVAISFFGSCLLWGCIWLATLAVALTSETEIEHSRTTEILAMKDNSNINGRFYLSSGILNEEQYYYFISNTNKGKKMNKVSSNISYINEGDYKPHVKVYSSVYTKEWVIEFLGEKVSSSEAEYIFFVPSGTVTTDFKVDLE